MLIRLAGGRVVDPANGQDAVADVWLRDERIVAPPEGEAPDATYDLAGKIVMAGAIDIHTHVAGINVNTSRLLLPEQHWTHAARRAETPLGNARRSTFETGRLYAEMGYTMVVEPAVPPSHALHAHLELADIPILDTAALLVIGNDDFTLNLLHGKEGRDALVDYVRATLRDGRGLGIKVINAGGAAAFKENVRTFGFDDEVPSYGLSSREIVLALQEAVVEAGVPHPLHVHCNNLGVPGAFETALTTMDAAGDRPMHFAHLQFYGYGREGRRHFSSAAAALAERVNARPNVTVDVGQVMFGPTVTVSSDTLRQYAQHAFARPKKWVVWDGIGNGGGIVPIRYRHDDFVNAVQWAIGLELFLLIDDPWRVYFTTDHPNGAHFTTYPAIIHLLMDREERARWLERLPKTALEATDLEAITREYSLYEIAIMTRASPARLLGLPDRGHLGPGALADVAVYHDLPDRAAMFADAHLVFKSGDLVVRDGAVTHYRPGRTVTLRPDVEAAMSRRIAEHNERRYGLPPDAFAIPESAIAQVAGIGDVFEVAQCRR
ncbi:formylmethanofuran dehydrogenase subunit A [Faunimonas sp. B44]|uniref:formylmethanofuran dehydrogenase subunit A n=1 Tax=Faunimonas sp. B44 TaxID=3461493 RepID=UPI00404461B1